MQRDYDLFERLLDGSVMWKDHARGLPEAHAKLQRLAASTLNECFAICLETREIAYRLNAPKTADKRKPLVFQIAYDSGLSVSRGDVLRRQGYEVVSVIGNEAAKMILDSPYPCDLFMLGHSAPLENRKEMVAWLKARYPDVRILALNPPTVSLEGADYNVKQNGPELWLPLVVRELGGSQRSFS